MHLTLGILRTSQAVSHALSFFWLDGFAVPAPAQVTQTVGQFLAKYSLLKNIKLSLAENTALPYNAFMEFIEAVAFTKYLYDYLSEDEYIGLQGFLLQYPESGKIVRGSDGVRKVRWVMAGRGKSGGVRVIYYFKKQDNEIWLLTIYSKSEMENIPAHVLREIAKEIENV